MRNFQNLLLVSLLMVTLFISYSMSAAVGQQVSKILTLDYLCLQLTFVFTSSGY